MGIEHNPIFQLAQIAYEEGVQEKEVIARSESIALIKKIRTPSHFQQVLNFLWSSLLEERPYFEMAPEIALTAFHCASMKKIKGKLWLQSNLWAAIFLLSTRLDIAGALRLLRIVRKTSVKIGDRSSAAAIDIIIGGHNLFFGKAANDPIMLRKVLDVSRYRSVKKIDPKRHLRTAMAQGFLGEFKQSAHSVDTAGMQFGDPPHQLVNFLVDTHAAYCHYQMGEYDLAYERLSLIDDRGFGPWPKIGLAVIAGMILRALGKYTQAIQRLQEAVALAEKYRANYIAFYTKTLLATTYRRSGEPQEAIRVLEELKQLPQSNSSGMLRAHCMATLGLLYGDVRRNEEALELLESARRIASLLGIELLVGTCDSYEAWIKAKMGYHEEALQLFDKAAKIRGRFEPPMTRFHVALGKGVAFQTVRQFDSARKHFEEGIAIIEALRGLLMSDDHRSDFLESKHSIYFRLIDCLLEQGDHASAIEYLEKLKNRNLSDLLMRTGYDHRNAIRKSMAEHKSLRDLLGKISSEISTRMTPEEIDEFADQYNFLSLSYDKLLGRLKEEEAHLAAESTATILASEIRELVSDDKTALIELFPLDDKTVAFVVLQSREIENATVIIRDYTNADLTRDLHNIHDVKQLDPSLERLYTKLFVPIKPYLTGIKKLILIPYSGLHLIPLHAMFTVENGQRRYLVDDYLITYAPSAKILKASLKRDVIRGKEAFVAFSNPRDDLPHSIQEAESVARSFGTNVVENATRGDIIERGKAAGVLHFTGHADGNALILNSQEDEKQRDRYDVGDIFTSLSTPNAWLVTLSACDTGKVRLGKTDEYIGLPSAFLHAGAATVICSLWSVSDLSTTLLMSKMYELLHEGGVKAEALREAQRWLKNPENQSEHRAEIEKLGLRLGLSSEDGVKDSRRFKRVSTATDSIRLDDLHKPYYWAGFICTGEP